VEELTKKQEKLNGLEERRKELFELQEPINRELETNYEKIEKVKNEIGKILIEKNPCDWELLLEEKGGQAIYDQYNKELRRRGLIGGGYFPETGQRCIKISLIKNSEDSYDNTIRALLEILPFVKPLTKETDAGYKYIGILESTISEHGVYFFLIDDEKNKVEYKLMKTIYGRTSELKKFNSLSKAIKYVQENHWYSENEDF